MMITKKDKEKKQKTAMKISLGIAILMLVGKMCAFYITSSAAILSDAAESVTHISSTIIICLFLWYTFLPVNKAYPYGYGKLSHFAQGLEGALIFMAAFAAFYAATIAIVQKSQLQKPNLGIAIIVLLTLINLVLGLFVRHRGKICNSSILIAHAHHILADMWTSFGVVLGVFLTSITHIWWLDPLVAIVVGLNILKSGIELLLEAYAGLVEKVKPKDTEKIIHCLQNAIKDKTITDFHQLRFRHIDDKLWIEMHLLLPGSLTLAQAHKNASRVEESLTHLFSEAEVVVTSHLEPDNHKMAHPKGHIQQDFLKNET